MHNQPNHLHNVNRIRRIISTIICIHKYAMFKWFVYMLVWVVKCVLNGFVRFVNGCCMLMHVCLYDSLEDLYMICVSSLSECCTLLCMICVWFFEICLYALCMCLNEFWKICVRLRVYDFCMFVCMMSVRCLYVWYDLCMVCLCCCMNWFYYNPALCM